MREHPHMTQRACKEALGFSLGTINDAKKLLEGERIGA
jgi:hypothetical protein